MSEPMAWLSDSDAAGDKAIDEAALQYDRAVARHRRAGRPRSAIAALESVAIRELVAGSYGFDSSRQDAIRELTAHPSEDDGA